MPRKLKTYQASIGFYDLGIAAPSMKAALEAWGAASNLFHQGFAKEADDPDVIAATMKDPGVVLRRPIGSQRKFTESADLPDNLPAAPSQKVPKAGKRAKQGSSPNDDKVARKAAAADEKEQRKNEASRKRAEAAQAKTRERREAAIKAVQDKWDAAEKKHQQTTNALDVERDTIEQRLQAENERWEMEAEKLDEAMRRAKSK